MASDNENKLSDLLKDQKPAIHLIDHASNDKKHGNPLKPSEEEIHNKLNEYLNNDDPNTMTAKLTDYLATVNNPHRDDNGPIVLPNTLRTNSADEITNGSAPAKQARENNNCKS